MKRMPILLSVAFLAASSSACDQPKPASRPTGTENADSFGNAAAAQSIMQPKVIAEAAPTPTPSPTPTARSLPAGITVQFTSGVALDTAARSALDRLAGDPALPPDARLVLRGNSDSPGSDQDNLAVSRRRALIVRDYLTKQGIALNRLTVIALGERRPVAPNANLDGSDDPAGRARNRRVDVEVVAEPALAPPPTSSVKPAQASDG